MRKFSRIATRVTRVSCRIGNQTLAVSLLVLFVLHFMEKFLDHPLESSRLFIHNT